MYRVLKPGGKALILDLRPDASSEAINAEINKLALGWFRSLLTRLIFKYSLVKRAYSETQFRQMASETPLHTCEIQKDGIGLAVSFRK
jgi:ubiquinone/menaquinone biosynthesis C-methylase UbiE